MADTNWTLQNGYDWLCICGESNYEEERQCSSFVCNKQRTIGEANYQDSRFVNGNLEKDLE